MIQAIGKNSFLFSIPSEIIIENTIINPVTTKEIKLLIKKYTRGLAILIGSIDVANSVIKPIMKPMLPLANKIRILFETKVSASLLN
jgi:hypothetical protein